MVNFIPFLPGLIVIIAFFCESLFGFGGGLISIPLLSLLLPVKNAVTLVLLFQFLMGFLLIKTYKHTDWKTAVPMTVGLLFGTLAGTYVLSVVSDVFLRKFLATSIVLFLIKMVFLPKLTFGEHHQRVGAIISGLVGGIFQGVIGTGGPIFTMYLAAANLNKTEFRATLIYLFFVTSVIRLITSVSTGLINTQLLGQAAPMVPFFLLAIFAGQFIHHKIPEKYFRYAVHTILFFAALSLFFK